MNAYSVISPARALAWSEARTARGVDAPEIFFWQSAETCVVVGLSQNAAAEVQAENLRADGAALYRRQSGGGAVVLGADVLCFAAFMPVDADTAALSIRESFAALCAPVIAAGSELTGQTVAVRGISDLTLTVGGAPRKFCGTAQLRKRKTILVHGSILVSGSLQPLERYLAFPAEVPDYRASRPHREFCITLSDAAGRRLTLEAVAAAIASTAQAGGWRAAAVPPAADDPEEAALMRCKYLYPPWNWSRQRGGAADQS